MFMGQTKVSYEVPTSGIYERKFNTAIRSSFDVKFNQRVSAGVVTQEDRLLLESDKIQTDISDDLRDPDYYANLLTDIIHDSYMSTKVVEEQRNIRNIQEMCEQAMMVQLGYILENNQTCMKTKVMKDCYAFFRNRPLPPLVVRLESMATWLIGVIEETNGLCAARLKSLDPDTYVKECLKINSAVCPYLDFALVWNRDMVRMKIKGLVYLLPKPCILLVHNKICDLISVLLLSTYLEGTVYRPGCTSTVIEFVDELCGLLRQYKNQAFDIFRVLEGLGIAETLKEVEEWDNSEFFNAIVSDLRDSVDFDYPSSNLRVLLMGADIPFRHELMCLSKIVGHPLVDMKEGAEALYKNVSKPLEIDMNLVNETINYIKENYIRNHILKYGKWPPCVLLSPAVGKALEMAFIQNKDPNSEVIRRKYGEVDIRRYVHIDLLPNMKFSYLENAIPYLKDKTISILRSQVIGRYIEHNASEENLRKGSWAETRCLLAYLLNPKYLHDHVEFIKKFEQDPELEESSDYLVLRCVPKEKELKFIFRGYGCKTAMYRLMSQAQERASKRYMELTSDEQAMTLSELEMFRKLRSFRSLWKAYKGYTLLYGVIDASKWNNMFRDLTVDVPMKETLSKVFDNPIFGRTHEAYQKTLVYIPDGDTVYWWDGQDGGIEGQNQDTWVIVYIAQIKKALEGLNVKYHLLVKGDDLRIAIAIPNTTLEIVPMKQIKNLILGRIADLMASLGHKIKLEESYGSSRYFAFSKTASCDNIELPQSFRKIQKAYGASNAFIPTLDEYIAATFSNAHSACKTLPTVVGPYLVALHWSLYYLTHSSQYKDLRNAVLVALLLVPSMVGGFPIIYLHNMPIRAESDLLSPFLGLYMYCRRKYPELADVMERFLTVPVEPPTSKVMLFKDPYALAIDRPPLPSAKLRGYITPALRRLVKREEIRELLEAAESEETEQIVRVLETANPFNVKVLSCMYAATPRGTLDELTRKFEASRSVNELIILRYGRRKSDRMIRAVIRAETTLQTWRSKRAEGREDVQGRSLVRRDISCPAAYAAWCRKVAWGVDIEGITMPPLQHQLHIVSASESTATPWENKNHFTFRMKNPSLTLVKDQREHYSTADGEPFIGYTTRTGNIAPTAQFIEHDPILVKLKNLLDVESWTNISVIDEDGNEHTSNARVVIDTILASFTRLKVKDLSPFAGVRKSGTSQHHIRAPSYRESIVPNILTNVYTRFSGESDSHIRLRSSHDHYKVNFLHCFCYGCWQMSLELEFGKTITYPSEVWGVTTQCEFCNRPIREKPIMFDLRNIRSAHSTLLTVTRIGEVSEMLLRASVEELNLKNPHVLPDSFVLSTEIATVSIMQELIDSTYHNRMSLQDRYAQYHLTPDAYSTLQGLALKRTQRDIGTTEIKSLNLEALCDYIITLIGSIVEEYFDFARISDIDILIAETPGEEYPWYGVVHALHVAGRLPEVIRWFSQRSMVPPPSCYYSPATAGRYLGRVSYDVYGWMGSQPYIVVLSYYNNSTLANHLRYKLRRLVWKYYVEHVRPLLRRHSKSTSEEDASIQEQVLGRIAVAFHATVNLDALCTRLSEVLITQVSVEDKFMSHLELSEDSFALTLETYKTTRIFRDVSQVQWQKELVEEYMENLSSEEVEEALSRMVHESSLLDIKLYYCTLDHCIRVARSSRPRKVSEQGDRDPSNAAPLSTHGLSTWVYKPAPSTTTVVVNTKGKYDASLPYSPSYMPLQITYYTPDHTIGSRILGLHGGSEVYLVQLLIEMGATRMLEHVSNVACLADGTGGFSNVLYTLAPYPIGITYHTLQERVSIGKMPENLLLNHPESEEHLRCEHLDEGYDDLSVQATWVRLEQYHIAYEIITCDIELPDGYNNSHKNIYLYLGAFALRNLAQNGMLIARVNMTSSYASDVLMSLVRPFFTTVYLTVPATMKRYKWAYVVCMGLKTVGHKIEYVDTTPMDPYVAQKVQSLQKRMMTNLEEKEAKMDLGLDFLLKDYYHVGKLIPRIPSRAEEAITNYLGITVTYREGETWASCIEALRKNWSERTLEQFGLSPVNRIAQILARLRLSDLPPVSHDQRWRTDTQAHRVTCVKFYWRLVGFLVGLNSYDPEQKSLVISRSQYKSWFRRHLRLLPVRDRYGSSSSIHLDNSLDYGGPDISYGCPYTRGLGIAISLCGTIKYTDSQLRRDYIGRSEDI